MATATAVPPPLCVDCDGTLIRTDLLHEAVMLLVKQAPETLLLLPFWLLKGKAHLKRRIAERVKIQYDTLPVCEPVIELMRQARAAGRRVVLATASPRPWAEAVAAQVGGFDEVVATTETLNLAGNAKADRLVALYGHHGFDYVGNSASDVPVWARARHGIVVSSSRRLIALARSHVTVTEAIASPRAGTMAWLKLLRVHQWLKNLLVFVPVAASHRLNSLETVGQATLAFGAFCLCASSVYLLNDLFDLESDRQHIRKRQRALACGRISISAAVAVTPLLLAASLAVSLWLPNSFLLVLGLYFASTLIYSLRLKRQVTVDLMMLAGLYTLRVIAGAAATEITPSFWLLAFSVFLFFSLAVVKRYSEMQIVFSQAKQQAAGRGYVVSDMPVLLAVGVAAGTAAVMVISLYINDVDTRALHPHVTRLWLIPPLVLYWIVRVWLKAHRGEIHDDPVVFAIRDWQSLAIVVLVGICFVMASQ